MEIIRVKKLSFRSKSDKKLTIYTIALEAFASFFLILENKVLL